MLPRVLIVLSTVLRHNASHVLSPLWTATRRSSWQCRADETQGVFCNTALPGSMLRTHTAGSCASCATPCAFFHVSCLRSYPSWAVVARTFLHIGMVAHSSLHTAKRNTLLQTIDNGHHKSPETSCMRDSQFLAL